MAFCCPVCKSTQISRAGYTKPLKCWSEKRARQRFQCRRCGKRFSENYYALGYQLKKPDPALNAKIFNLSLHGLSNRAIGRLLYISEHCVRLRLLRMARQALCFHAELLRDFRIKEDICMDGLENFAGSQYDPNNVQQALGSRSLFIYDFNLATLNRKGRMSDWQKRRLCEIEGSVGRYNPKAIRIAARELIARLHARRDPCREFVLITDEHFQYRRAIRQDLAELKIRHDTISSKACRNFQNILFPVNHADLLIRDRVAAFTRETISFSKTHAAMCQKYALFMIKKNYMDPQFTKKHVRRPDAHTHTPAQIVGLTKTALGFGDIFFRRSMPEDLRRLNREWRALWQSRIVKGYQRRRKKSAA